MTNPNPVVSAIISTYNSEKFIEGRIVDLLEQTIADRIEIIIVNSGSAENEGKIIQPYLRNYTNVHYLRTEQRESIYKAWNRGIKVANGKYITNANTDDRLKKDALEILASHLEKNPKVAIVSADQKYSYTSNEKFDEIKRNKIRRWNDFSITRLLEASLTGPQPMWRASLHLEDEIWFDENLEVAGDYDFACKVALKYKLYHIPKVLGSYYLSTSRENKEYKEQKKGITESYHIRNKYCEQYIRYLSFQELEIKIHYYNKWSQAGKLLFYFWKLLFKIISPARRLETREFVTFFAVKLNSHLGLNKNAMALCDNYLSKYSSFDISSLRYSLTSELMYKVSVSVIIPTFDRPNFLDDALESLTNQSFKDFEVIVINNGEVKISDLIERFSGRISIRLYDSEIKGNVSHAKNIGLKAASGKYVAYLDDDDWYHPEHLQTLYDFLENSEIMFAYTDALVELQDKKDNTYFTTKKFVEYSKDFNRNLLLIKDYIFTPCVMHHRRCFEVVGYFDEKLSTDEDMDMWIRMSRIYDFKHIKKVTCSVRRTSDTGSLTKDWSKMYQNAKYLNEKHSNYGKFNPIVCLGRKYYLELRKSRAKRSQYGTVSNYY
ncbi:MAG: glycosyltransferase [Ignavibacteriota bacterium]|jgi:glycosyltransferase involved in cell wall biosynthesis|nr:MAG: glycosyltransferase [Chlorobiota bacterium]MBE7476514.1 glycosyltransferase [Ignavibacteriales bacterium]MBL1123655.1 glycosyltransferase [Ignavibacteriota bacterium]MCC7094777.1 glycosyltransferase [Ignavibacteriaceae bacterium]MCE7855488.1 glycosyltransferase [Ignavibacteria bacterium CHB3]MEB2294904.1 glycosyltransferase [Ignavibacteria bacterium]